MIDGGEVKKVSVVGLGKLGCPMVACFASRGFEVWGVDSDPAKLEALGQGKAPVSEPGLQELISQYRQSIRAASEIEEAVLATQATFVIVPTPSDSAGGFSLSFVLPVCSRIANALAKKDSFHLVVVTSTVMPGATGGKIKDELERESGKQAGKHFGLCYSPEFIALGSVVRDLLNPDFVLIGESDSRSGEILRNIYLKTCLNVPAIARMKYINAEIAKIAVNSFVTTKITFANTLARICERTPGAAADIVTAALGLDSRIGSKYLKGAIGYGGPCFPRDNLAFACLAQRAGVEARLAIATDKANREQVKYVGDLIEKIRPPGAKVGIMGLAYKPDTDVVEESQGILLVRRLLEQELTPLVYDPLGLPGAKLLFGDRINYAASLEDCLRNSDLLVITTPWPQFSTLKELLNADAAAPKTIVDCWGILGDLKLTSGLRYIALGRANAAFEA